MTKKAVPYSIEVANLIGGEVVILNQIVDSVKRIIDIKENRNILSVDQIQDDLLDNLLIPPDQVQRACVSYTTQIAESYLGEVVVLSRRDHGEPKFVDMIETCLFRCADDARYQLLIKYNIHPERCMRL